jgi:DNA repair protein RadB
MIPIGCRNIDALLSGGLLESAITQVYGAPGTGKSNIAIFTAFNAAKAGNRVLFIDTEGSFHQERVKQIFGNGKAYLKNITLVNVSDFESQKDAIFGINKKYDLVIVDSMTSLYRVERTDENHSEINKELGKQATVLLAYARKNNVPVLITNQVYTNMENGEAEPVGGDILKYYSKIIMKLEKDDRKRKLILKKHVCKRDGGECLFTIVENGLIDS